LYFIATVSAGELPDKKLRKRSIILLACESSKTMLRIAICNAAMYLAGAKRLYG